MFLVDTQSMFVRPTPLDIYLYEVRNGCGRDSPVDMTVCVMRRARLMDILVSTAGLNR